VFDTQDGVGEDYDRGYSAGYADALEGRDVIVNGGGGNSDIVYVINAIIMGIIAIIEAVLILLAKRNADERGTKLF